jgi:hypothetical protein
VKPASGSSSATSPCSIGGRFTSASIRLASISVRSFWRLAASGWPPLTYPSAAGVLGAQDHAERILAAATVDADGGQQHKILSGRSAGPARTASLSIMAARVAMPALRQKRLKTMIATPAYSLNVNPQKSTGIC